MATEDELSHNQFAFAEKVEKEDRELLTTASVMAADRLFQVEEKKVETLTEELHQNTKTYSDETTNEFTAGNLGSKEVQKFSESPMLFEVAGKESNSSLQSYKDKDIKSEADRENSKPNLIAEEDLQYPKVEDTIKEASSRGIQPHAEEESKDLNRDEAGCMVQEETIQVSQQATSTQTTGVKDHLSDSTQDINLDTAELLVTFNQVAGQENTFNTSTASIEDLHETGHPKKEEKYQTMPTILDGKKMEPEELNSNLNMKDETIKKAQSSSDQTEVPKENSHDVEMLPHSVKVEDESTGKIENLSDFSRNASTETEYQSNHCKATGKNSPDAEILPHSVTVKHETTKKVESFLEHMGNVSIETECTKELDETTKGDPLDAKKLLYSVNMEDETRSKVEISSDLAESIFIEIEGETDHSELKEGTLEHAKVLQNSVILEDETTEKVERSSEHTRTVSTETESGTDPGEVTKVNIHDDDSHPVEVEAEKIEKAESLSGLARNVSIETGGSNYNEATRAEISENVEIVPGNSLITPSINGTSTWEAVPGKTNHEVKSKDNSAKEEILEVKMSNLSSENVRVFADADCPNKPEKGEIENGPRAEHSSSNSLTEEILLNDVGPEKVQELEEHSGTTLEKEDRDREDISYIELASVKEVLDMIPIISQENKAEVDSQKRFLEFTVKSTESAMDKAEERPESSFHDSVMRQEQILQKGSQEQILAEILEGEDRQDEVFKGSMATNIEAEEPVRPEIFNTEKDLEDLLPKNETGKESHNESLQAASMPLEKIELSQHSERATSTEDQRPIECLEGDLSEEKDSTSNASKSKAEDSLQEYTTIVGSNKDVNSAILNNTVDKMYETGRCSESSILEEVSTVVEPSLELTSTTEKEGDNYEKYDVIDIENKTLDKDEFPSGKEETFAPPSSTDNERKLVEDLFVENGKTECHKREADYIKDDKEIRSNDSEDEATELKEDQTVVEEVQKDKFSKDEEIETQIIGKEQVVTENSEESSAAEKNKSNHEAADVEADGEYKGGVYSNYTEETKVSDSEEGASELKEDQIVVKEEHTDTFIKDEEKEMPKKDQEEVFINYVVEPSVAEENKSDNEVKTEATNPEADDVHKGEAVYSNDDEEIKGNDPEELAPEPREFQIAAEEVCRDTFSKCEEKETEIMDKEEVATEYVVESFVAEENKPDDEVKAEATSSKADDVHKGEAKKDEEIKGKDPEEASTQPKEDEIVAEEARKDMLGKDKEKETQITDKEHVANEYLVESSVAEENNPDNEVTRESTNPEADDVPKNEEVYSNGDEEIEVNEPEKVTLEPKGDQIAAEEACLVHRDILSKDEEKEAQIIDRKEVAKEYLVESSVAEENRSDHKVKIEETNAKVDDVHRGEAVHHKDDEEIEGNDPEEVPQEPKEDQIVAEEENMETLSKDEEKEMQKINKEEVATDYLVESSVAEENKSDHEDKPQVISPEGDDVHNGKADHPNDDEEIEGHSEEEAAEPKEDQIVAEEVYKDTFSEDEEEETEILDKEEVTMEYLVESSVAEENKSDHKIKIESTNPGADDVHKGEAVHNKNDEEIEDNDPEEVSPQTKEYQIVAEEENMETFNKHEEKEMQIIDKEEVATESLVISSVTEENKSGHEVKTEVINADGDDVHKGKADHLNDEDIEGHSEEVAAEPKEDQNVTEEVYEDTFSKDEEKETQILEKEEVTTEYLVDSSVAEENKPDHKVKIESTDPGADDVHKGEAVHNKDDEEIEDNDPEEVLPQTKEYQIVAEEENMETFNKDGEKDMQKIDKKEVATESLVISSVTEENKSDHEVKTEVINADGDDVHKVKADHLNDDEGIEGHSEEAVAEPKEDQNVTEEAYEDTFSKDEEKEMQMLEKEKVVAEYLVESSVAEKDKSDHEVKTKATSSEAGDALKGEADYINADVEIESNDPDEVAPEPKEDQIVAKEIDKDTFRKDEEKQTQKVEREKIIAERLVESSIAEKDMRDHEFKTEAKNPKAGDVHNRAENIDRVEYKKTQNELQESLCGDTIGEDKIVTQKPKEEFGAQHDFATFSTEEMKEDSCRENQKREIDSETITQSQDNGEQIAKETDSSNNCHTKSVEEEIVQEEEKANKHTSADTKMNKEESQNVAIPISMRGERPVAGSSKQEEWDVMEPEKETKNLEIEGAKQNNEATHYAKEGEKETVKHEGNTDAAGTFRLAEGLPPRDQQLAANPSAVTEISEKMLATMESAEIRSVQGSLDQEQWGVPVPEKETKDVDIEGTTQNDETPHSAQDGEMETIKHEGKAAVAGSPRLAEGLPPREYQELAENSSALPEISDRSKEKMLDTTETTEIRPVEGSLKPEEWDVMEPEKEPQHLETESTTQNDEATHSAQDGETEMVKHEVIADAAGTDRLTEGLPLGDQELAENSSAVPENSEKSKKKMLDSTESTETRSVQGTLKQEQQDVLEPEKETKDVDKQGTTENDQPIHSAQESETETIKHERNADTAGMFRLTKGLPQGENQELAENSSAVPEVSEKSKEKMFGITESTEIAVTGETKEVKLPENMLLDNNTPTPEEMDLAATERNETKENDTVRIYEHQQLSSLEDNEEIKVLAGDGSDGDSTRRICVLDGQNNICDTLLRSVDHVASGGTLSHDTLQQNSQDPTMWPLNEQNIITAEAYKTADETPEKFEASGITTEAVPAAEDKEIQKPVVGEEEFASNNNSNSSKNFSTNRKVLDLKAEDQVHQTEDSENNQTRSIAGKESNLVQSHEEYQFVSELRAEECSNKSKPGSRMARDQEGTKKRPRSTDSIKEGMAGQIFPYCQSEKEEQQELKLEAKEQTDEEQYDDDKAMKSLSTEEAKQVLVGAEQSDDHETMTEKIKGGKILVDNFKSRQEERLSESTPSQISEAKHSNQTTDDASLTEVVNQVTGPINLALEANDTHLQPIQDPGVVTSDETTKTTEDNLQDEKAFPITQEAAEEQKERNEDTENGGCSIAESADPNTTAGKAMADGEIQIVKENGSDKENGAYSNYRKCHDTKPENHEEVVEPTLASNQTHPAAIEGISSVMLSEEADQTYSTIENKKDQSTMINECILNESSNNVPVTTLEKEFLQKEGKTAVSEHRKNGSFFISRSSDLPHKLHNELEEANDGQHTALSHKFCNEFEEVNVLVPEKFLASLPKVERSEEICHAKETEMSEEKIETASGEKGDDEILIDESDEIEETTRNDLSSEKERRAQLGDEKRNAENFSFCSPESEISQNTYQEDVLQPEVHIVEISDLIKNTSRSAKMPSEDETTEEPCQALILEEKGARTVEETTRVRGLHEEDGHSHSGNITTEFKILNEKVDSFKVLSPEINEENHAQGNIDRKDTEVNITSTYVAPLVDNVSGGEASEELGEHRVNILSVSSDFNSSALVKTTKEGPFRAASANDVSFRLEMEKLEAFPFSESEKCTTEEADRSNCSTDSKNILQLHQKATLESPAGDNLEPPKVKPEEAVHGEEKGNLEPPKVKPEEAVHGEEKGTSEEATLPSVHRETSVTSLSDLLQASKKEISQVANELTAETEQNVQKVDIKTEMAEYEEPKTDEEGEGDEEKRTESAHDSPVTVEAPSDSDIKAAHKKSHNILSGVGSKVKHSIAKVKKAITGKSSHPRPPSPK